MAATYRSQWLCIWSGPLAIALFFMGFWPLARFFPPLAPSLPAEQVVALFQQNAVGIRFGGIMLLLSCALLLPFYAQISVQLKRIEGAQSPMTYAQMMCGVLAVVAFIPATIAWCTAAYRPDRDPALIVLLNDIGWIMLFMTAAPAMVQFIVIGIAILSDRSAQPILPRCFAYFTLWCALVGTPGSIIVFFKHGPFAWDGLFGFWIPASARLGCGRVWRRSCCCNVSGPTKRLIESALRLSGCCAALD